VAHGSGRVVLLAFVIIIILLLVFVLPQIWSSWPCHHPHCSLFPPPWAVAHSSSWSAVMVVVPIALAVLLWWGCLLPCLSFISHHHCVVVLSSPSIDHLSNLYHPCFLDTFHCYHFYLWFQIALSAISKGGNVRDLPYTSSTPPGCLASYELDHTLLGAQQV
jgi:hypothetical protein